MLQDLQNDFDTNYPYDIQILGINQAGFEAGNADICDGRDLPWLQDTAAEDVWGVYAPVYRDVWVLDADNVLVGVFNLTGTSLAIPANYNTLRDLFLTAAGAP
ncbi:MAG: hypothetical protein GY898_17565 [Proteobacteria bacterium]|nr:hypothetical protein [Pseudomonadota bacterium]